MRYLYLVLVSVLVALPVFGWADNGTSKKPAKRGPSPSAKKSDSNQAAREKIANSKSASSITDEQESAAIALVQQHHKDLFELLIHLKEGLPQEYDRAIRDLSRASERLSLFKKRDAERYRLELQLWQAESRRQLVTAKLQMGHDESLLKELRKILNEEQRLELAVLRHERERLAGRIAKIDEQISSQEKNAEATMERKLATLSKAAKNAERTVTSKNRKPTVAKDAKDPT